MNRKVRRCTEPEQSYAISFFYSRHAYRAKTYDAGAEQRSGVQIIQRGRNRKAKISSGQSVFSVAAVHGVSGERG